MESKGLTDAEMLVMFRAAEEFQTKGVTTQTCPRCNGKLHYIGAGNSYSLFCENKSICGFWESIRGI